jgi:NADH kinase
MPVRAAGPGAPPIDLVLTLGGDGTILHASSLFRAGPVPPVLSFSLGTLGFLLPFRPFLLPVWTKDGSADGARIDIDDYPAALHSVFEGKYALLERLRLACTFLGPDGTPRGGPDDGTCRAFCAHTVPS